MADKTDSGGVETERAVVDPTRNVLDLVKAESKYQDGMRNALGEMRTFALDAESKMQTFALASESKMQNWMRDAESKRLDQLASQRDRYEDRISLILSEATKDKSLLVSGQLVQIQATFDARVSKLEEFRLLSTGRSSVADPALASSLGTLATGLQDVQAAFTATMREHTAEEMKYMRGMSAGITALQDTGKIGSGRETGRREVVAWIVAAGMFVAALVYPMFQILHAIK